MKTDDQHQGEKEFRATLLDQNRRALADAKVVVMPSREEGSIYPFGDVAVSRLCSSVKFLQVGKGAPVRIFELRGPCPTGGWSHFFIHQRTQNL
jgi:hypothetical protein